MLSGSAGEGSTRIGSSMTSLRRRPAALSMAFDEIACATPICVEDLVAIYLRAMTPQYCRILLPPEV